MHDLIIIGAGASGLFFASIAPKHINKIILEKSEKIGSKVLMSGGERCNLSNTNITPDSYFGSNTQGLHSIFTKFSYPEILNFCKINHIETITEPHGRILLKSGKSKELQEFLVKQTHQNNTQILTNHEVLSVTKGGDIFTIITSQGEFQTKKLIIATGGKSYPQIGATDIGRQIASAFGHTISAIHPGLCGIETKENLSSLTGNSCTVQLNLYHNQKLIHQETGPLLFTHRGISGPTVFNTTVALGNYLNQKKMSFPPCQLGRESKFPFTLGITINKTTVIKKIATFFHLDTNTENIIHIHALRPRTEAKVTVGGIPLNELTPHFESKKVPGLYFLGELIDITGKTGGFNLQRCRSSAYICAKNFESTKPLDL